MPSGSQTPRRFRCQPELAINSAIAQAQEQTGGPLDPTAAQAISLQLLGRLPPTRSAQADGTDAMARVAESLPA